MPYGFDVEKDSYILNPLATHTSICQSLMSTRNKNRNLFARDIRSYKNGSIISKQCAPWGNFSWLFNQRFIIVKRVANDGGEIDFVVVKEKDGEPNTEFYLGPAFFAGWTTQEALESYYNP